MTLYPQALKKIAGLTLDHYNQHAEGLWEGTRDHDVSQNIAAMLQYIEGEPAFTILDFGCVWPRSQGVRRPQLDRTCMLKERLRQALIDQAQTD